jgi:hypothetical protein
MFAEKNNPSISDSVETIMTFFTMCVLVRPTDGYVLFDEYIRKLEKELQRG